MTGNSGNVPVISLGNNFGKIVVEGAGIKVELDSDGHVTVYRNGDIVYPDGNINVSTGARPAIEDCVPVLDDATVGPEIGELVEGKGVYVGEWKPKDRDGNSLGKVFDLYAAPEDVKDSNGQKLLLTFNDAVEHVAGLSDYHGHDGFSNYYVSGSEPDGALYEAIKKGTYKGEWFIPPKDVLNDNLYQNKDKFKPENAFITINDNSGAAHWYWSCTEDEEVAVWNQYFPDGRGGAWDSKDNCRLSARLVRAEPQPA